MKIKEHLTHFAIAGFTYYEGVEVISDMKIGDRLKLKLEEDNKYDSRAVAIYYGKKKLGYVPRTENRILYKLLRVGFEGLRVRVQRIDPQAHPESQVYVVIHLTSF